MNPVFGHVFIVTHIYVLYHITQYIILHSYGGNMKKASRNGFSPEEQMELLKNPYTRTVTDTMIKFTDEFNDLFIKRHSQGTGPSIIFKDCGYDLDVIGSKRVVNYYNRLQRTYRYHTLIEQTHLSKNNNDNKKDYKSMPPSKAIEAMQHETTYLRQEIEFLKKIISLINKKPRN